MFKQPILTTIALATSLFLSTTVQAFDLYSATDSNTTATTETAPKKVNTSPQGKHTPNRPEPRKERRIIERKERERRAIERRERERKVVDRKDREHQERQQGGSMEHRENQEHQPKNSNPNKLNQEQPSINHSNPFVPTPASKTAPPPE